MAHSVEPLDMSDMKDCVGALIVQAAPEYAMKHGACKINESVSEPTSMLRGLSIVHCSLTTHTACRERYLVSLTWAQKTWSNPGPNPMEPVTW